MKEILGELRRSQLVSSFGVGSMVDLPSVSGVIMGLDYWDKPMCAPISEPRLLRAIQRVYGPSIQEIRSGPRQPDTVNNHTPVDRSGVPTAVFPRWLRCPLCSRLAPISTDIFKLQTEPFRIDRTRYIHEGCLRKGNRLDSAMPAAVPARFVVACEHGHLDDFPWVFFVHRGNPCGSPSLRLFESGVTGEAADVMVRCDNCERARPMSDAFGPMNDISIMPCGGYHVHLHAASPGCTGHVNTLLIGASNSYFPISLSVLSLPSTSDPIEPLLHRNWVSMASVTGIPDLEFLRRRGELAELEVYTDAVIWAGIERLKNPQADASASDESDIKRPEWNLLTGGGGTILTERMTMSPAVGLPPTLARALQRVLLLERFTEVRAMVGFTRLESSGDMSELDTIPADRRAPLARRRTSWVPGVEVKGEGVFLQFQEARIAEWENRTAVRQRIKQIEIAHENWCRARPWLSRRPAPPTARYVLLHTISHLLMREMGIRCGYGTASLRERIYCQSSANPDGPMAGLLIGTSSSDAEGTLGGLVALGRPEELDQIVRSALLRASMCSSDPICACYDPTDGQKLHGAACHSCAFVPETSCEHRNSYLDRAMVIETLESDGAAFFGRVE